MKTRLSLFLCAAAFALAAAPQFAPKAISPRSVKLEKRTIPMIKNGKVQFQLYVSRTAPLSVRQGAADLAGMLSEIAGTKIKALNQLPQDPAVTVLRYGDKQFAAEKKIDLAKIDRDGFVIAAFGNQILLAGGDALKDNEGRGTIFAGLDFLERFADARFYFPGKTGTLLPLKKNWSVPAMTIFDRPDNQYRSIHWRSIIRGKTLQNWYEPVARQQAEESKQFVRLRTSNLNMPNCHGLAQLHYVERFAKTHPEYFSVKPNG